MSARRNKGKVKQLELGLKYWGGKREGSGRKPKNGVAGVRHRPRGTLSKNHPAHVTMKLRSGLPVLRRKAEYAAAPRSPKAKSASACASSTTSSSTTTST
jgi:hypothetical protein